MKNSKIILIAILILVVGGLLIAWQNYLTKEKIEHPTTTEKKYFACMKQCNIIEVPFTELLFCEFSCQEKYGIDLPILPGLE